MVLYFPDMPEETILIKVSESAYQISIVTTSSPIKQSFPHSVDGSQSQTTQTNSSPTFNSDSIAMQDLLGQWVASTVNHKRPNLFISSLPSLSSFSPAVNYDVDSMLSNYISDFPKLPRYSTTYFFKHMLTNHNIKA